MTCDQIIVWLDENSNDVNSSLRTKLFENQDQHVKTFTTADSCLTFLEKNIDRRLFLIVSGSFGSTIVSSIYNYEHIHQIYLFCGSISNHVNRAIDYTDKLIMFDHENDLMERLYQDIEHYLRQQAEKLFIRANDCKERAKYFDNGPCG